MEGAAPPVSWTDSILELMRQAGDPLADNVISELFAGGEIASVNALMRNLIANEYPAPESLPSVVRGYLARSGDLPDWTDPKLIQAGEQVFWRYGPELILILYCYSLPFCYAGRNGVQALALTTRLMSSPARRIAETAQMLVDVMQPGGLTEPHGRGRRTIQKVRLMHGAIRKLAGSSNSWKAEYGLPVNQEDLAGTLMSFSWVALDGLSKIGIGLSDADRQAYLHCWLVIGCLLGIRAELLPGNLAAAQTLSEAIAHHQFGPCAEGQALTRALIDSMDYILPGTVFKHIPPVLIRYFLGPQWAGWLGIEESAATELACVPLRLLGFEVSELLEHSKGINALAARVGHLLIQSIVYVERGGNRPSFSIPADLRAQWGVS